MDAARELRSSFGDYNIPLVHIVNPRSRFILVYSHGNSEDVRLIFDWCTTLSKRLSVDVVAYDYCGYGMHVLCQDQTKPSEQNVLNDVMDVVQHAFDVARDDQMVVVYGRSLGSGPSVYAAAHHPDVSGLIIESGFLTCAKTVVNTGGWTLPFDMFRNENAIELCEQLTLVMHGTHDHVVPFSHGVGLHSRLKRPFTPCWIEGGGHNDLDTTHCEEIIQSLNYYMHSLLEDEQALARV